MSKKSKKSKILGRIWDGLGMILGWFGGIFGTISDRLWKVENLRAHNWKINLRMTSNTPKNQQKIIQKPTKTHIFSSSSSSSSSGARSPKARGQGPFGSRVQGPLGSKVLLGPGSFWVQGPFGSFWGLLGPFGSRVQGPFGPFWALIFLIFSYYYYYYHS